MGVAAVIGIGAAAVYSSSDRIQELFSFFPEAPQFDAPPVPPVPPELDPALQRERDLAAQRERERRALSGRASTVLTGGTGDLSTPELGSAVLLGQ